MTPESTLATGLGSLGEGTLVSLIIRKKGTPRGPTGQQKVYGDDLVHVLLWSGFHYQALAARSYKKLLRAINDPLVQSPFYSSLVREAWAAGIRDATVNDACIAVQEMTDQLRLASTERAPSLTPEVWSSGIWGPLVANGQPVIGAKIYRGGQTGVRQGLQPRPGTLYLDGVKLGEVVLNPAPNGEWEPDSAPQTRIKKILRSKLPLAHFVRYCLDEDHLLSVKTGKAASESAQRGGVPVDAETVRSLFKIA